MRTAWINFKAGPNYRRDSFANGFRCAGYKSEFGLPSRPSEGDVLVLWNRSADSEQAAVRFENNNWPVLVVENGYLGKEFAGHRWYAISRNLHNGAGTWPDLGNDRWNKLGVKLAPFRDYGSEIVLLPQRSIGSPGVAMPRNWIQSAVHRMPGRIRNHPGIHSSINLVEDLACASAVYTWGSGAAIKALAMGIPVYYDMPEWIGAPASARVGEPPNRSEQARLDMFRSLANAMWTLGEIESGEALEAVL